MTQCDIRVRLAGPLCSLQDAGRPGFLRYGVPGSGPMDRAALSVVNAALGNPPGQAAVEVSLGGLGLDCLAGEVSFAVAGGGFQVLLAGRSLAPWTVGTLRAGQSLTLRAGDWGSWALIGFAGQVRGTEWLGSLSTHSQSGLGGGAVTTGQRLRIDQAEVRPTREGDLPLPDWARPAPQTRVTIGPQERFFDRQVQAAFLGPGFALSQGYDRMGVRLQGPRLPVNAALDMPSEPILRGAVQVAGDGVATVMLADHGTTGGYPKLATLIGADLDRFVQQRSGDPVRFVAVTPTQAVAAARAAHADLQSYLAELAQPRPSLAQRLMQANLISGVTDGA
ncbi:MAG: biotin-dependent carboxyltransferase family protein [Alphaproteobacteria bacterium]